jgi:cell wall-associated NlpC family hydrolase
VRDRLGALPCLALVAALGVAPLAWAPAHADAAEVAKPLSDADRAKKAMRIARNQMGDPYKYGAEGPDKFDCSGLVYFATHKAGFGKVPRTSSEQADFMRRIKRSSMRPGDFVFFTSKGDVYHVGVFVGRRDGDRMIVHAPNPGEKVKRDPLWTDKWFAGTLRGA